MTYLNPKQKLALLSLYSEEIKKRLTPIYYSPETIGLLRELLDSNKFDEICLFSANETEFAENLWNSLVTSPMNSALYDTILSYLHPIDKELHAVLCCITENDSRSNFRLVLSNLDDFWTHLNVESTITFLKKLKCYGPVISRLELGLKGVQDESTKKKLVLRIIPMVGANAVTDLMRSIYDNSEEAAAFVNKLRPNFLRFYKLVDKERDSPRGVITFCPLNMSIEDVLDPSAGSKYEINLNYEDIPCSSVGSDSVMNRLLKSIDRREFEETPILLRDYQKELCESSLLGINTIIAAPTGCGKTIVAAYIIKNHLENLERSDRKPKVLFMTPTTVILDQQAACLRKFLGHRYQVSAAHASDSTPLREMVMEKDIIVSTPQLVVNMLNYTESEDTDLVRTPLDVTTFTLVVIDECHNAVKNSPYAVFMRICHRLNLSHRIKPGSSLPQILGLTASCGVGGASTEKDAINHVVKLCAVLNCQVISTVRKNADEIKWYSPFVSDDIVFCEEENNGSRPLFLERLCTLMRLFEKKFYEIYKNEYAHWSPHSCISGTDQAERPSWIYEKFTIAPEDKTSIPYLNWVSNYRRRIVPETTFYEETSKKKAIEMLEILHILYRAIELYQDFSTVESYKYLKEQFTARQAFLTEFSLDLWKDYSKEFEALQSSDNVLVSELVRLLLSNKDTDFRAIVFVRTRRGASILTNILNSHPELVANNLKAEFIAGFSKSSETTRKTEQMDKLKRFREGETRVLLSTSVADEGLDVVKCNLIIKYNCAANEIAHLQRKGRGRAKNSRSVLITQNIKLKEQEERNIMKGSLMNFVIDAIQENRIDLSSLVENAIEKLWIEIQMEDAQVSKRMIEQKSSNKLYKLLCSKCDEFLCTSKDIKTYKDTQFCVCDPDFWSRIYDENLNDADAMTKFGVIGKLHCKNCGNSIGRVLIIEGKTMPALGASAFVLEFTDSPIPTKRTVRKWSSVTKQYFTPDPIRNHDLMAMSRPSKQPVFTSDVSMAPCLSSQS